jgi:hypothetical protein
MYTRASRLQEHAIARGVAEGFHVWHRITPIATRLQKPTLGEIVEGVVHDNRAANFYGIGGGVRGKKLG